METFGIIGEESTTVMLSEERFEERLHEFEEQLPILELQFPGIIRCYEQNKESINGPEVIEELDENGKPCEVYPILPITRWQYMSVKDMIEGMINYFLQERTKTYVESMTEEERKPQPIRPRITDYLNKEMTKEEVIDAIKQKKIEIKYWNETIYRCEHVYKDDLISEESKQTNHLYLEAVKNELAQLKQKLTQFDE